MVSGKPSPENRPLVSVVMPAYNAALTIDASILSVLTQTYGRLELLVVNDASTDGTAEVVARYLSDRRLRYFNNKRNKGVAEARNVAIRKASGDYIAFCDADDRWLPDKLALQLAAMHDSGVQICGTNCMRIGERGKMVATSYEGLVTYDKMLVRQYIVNSSAIYDARVLGKHYQRRKFSICQDYDMWLRLFEKADAIVLPDNLVYYRVARSSLSGNKVKTILQHLHVQLEHGIPKHMIMLNLFRNMMSRLRRWFCQRDRRVKHQDRSA